MSLDFSGPQETESGARLMGFWCCLYPVQPWRRLFHLHKNSTFAIFAILTSARACVTGKITGKILRDISIFAVCGGVLADLDPPRIGSPGPNPLADMDPPIHIR